jgi:hypothetical protein
MIPCLFVSRVNSKYIKKSASRKNKDGAPRPVHVLLQGSMDVPGHHGPHWQDQGVSNLKTKCNELVRLPRAAAILTWLMLISTLVVFAFVAFI